MQTHSRTAVTYFVWLEVIVLTACFCRDGTGGSGRSSCQ